MTIESVPFGTLHIHDSSLSIWNREVEGSITEVYKALVKFLRSSGWKIHIDAETKKHFPSIAKYFHYGRKGDLELMLQRGGRHIELELFQNVCNVSHAKNGRYDFDKMKRMPYLLRLQAMLTHKQVEDFLMSRFGYEKADREFPRPGLMGSTAREYAEYRIRTSGHFRPELGRADWYADYNRRTVDGILLNHGDLVYYQDKKGRWNSGHAFYNLNSTWLVVSGRYGLSSRGVHELYASKPAGVRKEISEKIALSKVNQLIKEAVARADYLRAHQLKTVLEKQSMKLTTGLDV